jgi:subfamily B ATP-binding cassette protein MsbA
MGLSADYFTQQSTGTLISRVSNDTTYIDNGLASINIIIREPVTFLMLFAYTISLNWRLTVITFLIFPPLAWVFSATSRNVKRYVARIQEENARITSTLQESFVGVRIIKMFRLEGYVRDKFRARTESYTAIALKSAALEEVAHPMVELLTAFVIAAVIYFGGLQVVHDQMTTGELLAFFLAFAMMMNPLRTVSDVMIKTSAASAACKRIFEVLDWKPRLHESAAPKRIQGLEREIRFEDVRFAYPDAPDREILKGISLSVPKGKIVALVGASGAGKSSLASLLPRIFDVTGGSIRIDGADIREIALDDLRDCISVVSQDVFLFNDTIAENIRCGRLDATDAQIRDAATRAHALEFIERSPQGFLSIIGDRGQKLSGGERQRLSIARAFLRESPILILDEATSSLDSTSERHVQTALEELMRNRTTIVIAHRLSTVRHADQIVVLKEGRIIESGDHESLIRSGGEYAQFHRTGEMAP